MRWKTMVMIAGTAVFAVSARAEDDVVVDLSVLDSLSSSYAAPSQPLFPVLPEDTEPVKIKKKTAEPAVVIPAKKPAVPVKTADSSESEAKPVSQPEAKPVVLPEIKPEPLPEAKPVVKFVESDEPVVVVDVEPVSEPLTPPAAAAAAVSPAPAGAAKPAFPASESAPDVNPSTPAPVAEPVTAKPEPAASLPAQKDITLPEISAPAVDAVTPVETQAADVKPALLIDDRETLSETQPGRIVFAAGVDELTTQQMAEINDIVGKFKNTDKNKIAIYSYNLDDGVDSFKKKRISLNRAIAVRSFLLKKGYKNFSIKVININSGSDKVNTVELEEI